MSNSLEKLLEVENYIVKKYANQIGEIRSSNGSRFDVESEKRDIPRKDLGIARRSRGQNNFVSKSKGKTLFKSFIKSPIPYLAFGLGFLTYFTVTSDIDIDDAISGCNEFSQEIVSLFKINHNLNPDEIKEVQEILKGGRKNSTEENCNFFDCFEPYLGKAERINLKKKAPVYNVIADDLLLQYELECGEDLITYYSGDHCYTTGNFVVERSFEYYKKSNALDKNWYAQYQLLFFDLFENGLDYNSEHKSYCVAGEETQQNVIFHNYSWKSEQKREEFYHKAKEILVEVKKERREDHWERTLTELIGIFSKQSLSGSIKRRFMYPRYKSEEKDIGFEFVSEDYSDLPIDQLDPKTKIVSTSRINDNKDIYIVDADGSNQKRLTTHPKDDLSPSWSVDGRKIIFISDREGNNDIYSTDVNGNNLKNLTNMPSDELSFTLSPNGEKIFFVSYANGDMNISVMDFDGSNKINLTEGLVCDPKHYDWSLEWDKLFFLSVIDGNYDIYSVNSDGTNPTKLMSNPSNYNVNSLSFSYDINAIQFTRSNDSGNEELCQIYSNGNTECMEMYKRKYSSDWDPEIQICEILKD